MAYRDGKESHEESKYFLNWLIISLDCKCRHVSSVFPEWLPPITPLTP